MDFKAAAGGIFDRLLGLFVEVVAPESASMGIDMCQGALTGKQTLWSGFEIAAHLRSVILVWLRMAASADPPSAPMLLNARLQARVQEEGMLRGADTKVNALLALCV